MDAERLGREREFHDDLAASIDPVSLPAPEMGRFEEALLSAAHVRPGSVVLDLGCGIGDLSLILLARGAHVVALDLSAGMLDVARARIAEAFPAARVEYVCAPAEATALPDRHIDAVVGRYVLHHLDAASAAPELARVMRPGARAAFLENQDANPLLRLARERVAGRFGIPRYGTTDEHPLTTRDLRAFASGFSLMRLTYPIFEFAVIFDRQVLQFRHRRLSRFLKRLDQTLERRVPQVRKYSYRVLVTLQR